MRMKKQSSNLPMVIGISVLLLSMTALVGLAVSVYWKMGPGYFAEAKSIRKLAEEIPGVVVLDVDGNHDLTLEDIWLDIEYRGERLYFSNITTASFTGVEHLCVGQVGEWEFMVYGIPAGHEPPPRESLHDFEAEVHCYSWGGSLDFGPKGNVGARLSPPIRSIAEFLERLPEVRRVIMELPEEYPGTKVGEDEHVVTIIATGREKRTPLWSWAVREPAD